MKTEIIYVAGRYRARTLPGKILNIIKAYITALRISRKGYIVFCPHANTALFDLFCKHSDEFWLKAGQEFLKRSDALFLMKGWQNSQGSWGEYNVAITKRMPIYYHLREL